MRHIFYRKPKILFIRTLFSNDNRLLAQIVVRVG